MDARTMAATGATWQRMAVWLARAGYGDLEYSTVRTLQGIARPRPAETAARPAVAPVDLPLVLAAVAD